MQDFQPSATSLEHRAQIAKLISPLRPRHSKGAVLETRSAPHPNTVDTLPWVVATRRTRKCQRSCQSVISRKQTYDVSCAGDEATKARPQGVYGIYVFRESLNVGQWLDAFQSAKAGNTNLQAILDRYDRILAVRREEEIWKERIHQVFVRHRFCITYPIFLFDTKPSIATYGMYSTFVTERRSICSHPPNTQRLFHSTISVQQAVTPYHTAA
ncbi:hypothetical protein F5141DRAFT_355060 [Pisolithus sp. B1]|nr:hypothetical protein F5141DRAFT_355060 [Pisolithus sp. B1]